jgi:hypothetical protein
MHFTIGKRLISYRELTEFIVGITRPPEGKAFEASLNLDEVKGMAA